LAIGIKDAPPPLTNTISSTVLLTVTLRERYFDGKIRCHRRHVSLYTFLYAECFFRIPFCGRGISLGNGIAEGAEINVITTFKMHN
jgi:hypothetical protein